MDTYGPKHLREALENAGLPHGRKTIIIYIKRGIIKSSLAEVDYGDRAWRFYTAEDIQENIKRVQQYKSGLLMIDENVK